jgi:GNAT superfamily N-acetyltransferase
VRVLEFDTDWFGCRVGRCDGPPSTVDQWGKDNSVACLYTLVPLSKIASVHDLAHRGFRMVDVRVEFAARSKFLTSDARLADASDHEAIRLMAETAFQRTRFHNDRHFDRDRVNAMYANWALNTDAVALVVDTPVGPAGFVTIGDTHLELIAVEPSQRGHGYGRLLAAGAMTLAHTNGRHELRVVTQGGNHAAQRTFQSVGFTLVDTSLWLHKWYDR